MDNNPYSPPLFVEGSIPPATGPLYHRQDNLLIIRNGAVLPARCIHTNREVGAQDWTKRVRVTWTPPWVFALIVVNLLVLLIVAMCVNKKAFLTYSLSREARGKLIKRRSIAFLVFVAGVAGVIGSITGLEGDTAIVAGIASGIAALVALFVLALTNAISVKKHDDGWFSIKGCSPEFLNSL